MQQETHVKATCQRKYRVLTSYLEENWKSDLKNDIRQSFCAQASVESIDLLKFPQIPHSLTLSFLCE